MKILYLRIFLYCPRIPKNFQSISKVTFYVFNDNFFYTQVASAYVPDNADAFFLFLLK